MIGRDDRFCRVRRADEVRCTDVARTSRAHIDDLAYAQVDAVALTLFPGSGLTFVTRDCLSAGAHRRRATTLASLRQQRLTPCGRWPTGAALIGHPDGDLDPRIAAFYEELRVEFPDYPPDSDDSPWM